ncbi:metallophosphoesterase [Lysobacter sp. K5869]|uniref:metallophosphoesterase family protein n=1 Tax=Lysobacter sp. K5869 TaxID=2820808 RepID=UPI001C05FC97|nr:metallophosphoesterase [Lysobacter sp. K5869]QWP78116.1 metallophosphoesterase [Lysobacter sp. K5869]
MTRNVKLAILSDLHFSSDEKGKDETHVVLSRQHIARQHPYHDLLHLITKEKLTADIVLCPGDITFQADQAALGYAWGAINNIAGKLGAPHVFAATGNHDIISRNSVTSPEIWEYLKQLDPTYPYPGANLEQRLFYWAEHFLIADVQGVRIVALNTCNSHARGEAEFQHGRVTDYTIEKLESELKGLDAASFNILLCHHHPMRHPDLNQFIPDYSEMRQGPKLLSRLEASGQPWMVVHGHKHSPRLDYAQGPSGGSPVVFSAGSFSAVLPPNYFSGVSNQFYIVELDLDYIDSNGTAGIVHSWDWREGQGWIPARQFEGLKGRIPTGAGFGYVSNSVSDANNIAAKFNGKKRIQWSKVEAAFPWIRYVTPADLARILQRLKTHHKLDALVEDGAIYPSELLKEISP